ncbi:MAG: hypothetical protein AAGF26_17470 [Cyanobacteria bacterium P01_G01_bin.49]
MNKKQQQQTIDKIVKDNTVEAEFKVQDPSCGADTLTLRFRGKTTKFSFASSSNNLTR